MWVTSGSYVGHIRIVQWVNRCDPLSTLIYKHIASYIAIYIYYVRVEHEHEHAVELVQENTLK